MIARTPKPPYYAVIFTTIKNSVDADYDTMAVEMEKLAREQDGFLGIESTSGSSGGITVSYWKDLKSIEQWKNNHRHLLAQQKGREKWYNSYKTRVAKVERDYGFERSEKE